MFRKDHFSQTYEFKTQINEGSTLHLVGFRHPFLGNVSVKVSNKVKDALETLQRDWQSSETRKERHCVHLDAIPECYLPETSWAKGSDRILAEDHDRRVIMNAILNLPPKQKRRFVMRYCLGIPTRQIAHSEGCSMRAVEYCLRRAKRRLRVALKELR